MERTRERSLTQLAMKTHGQARVRTVGERKGEKSEYENWHYSKTELQY